jgi:hypothetical protein
MARIDRLAGDLDYIGELVLRSNRIRRKSAGLAKLGVDPCAVGEPDQNRFWRDPFQAACEFKIRRKRAERQQ